MGPELLTRAPEASQTPLSCPRGFELEPKDWAGCSRAHSAAHHFSWLKHPPSPRVLWALASSWVLFFLPKGVCTPEWRPSLWVPSGSRMPPVCVQACPVTRTSQPGPAIGLRDNSPSPVSQGCGWLICGSERPMAVTASNKRMREACGGFEGPEPSREGGRTGRPDLAEAGRFPW